MRGWAGERFLPLPIALRSLPRPTSATISLHFLPFHPRIRNTNLSDPMADLPHYWLCFEVWFTSFSLRASFTPEENVLCVHACAELDS